MRETMFHCCGEKVGSRSWNLLAWQYAQNTCSPFSLVLPVEEHIGNRTYVLSLIHFVCKSEVQISFSTDNVV